MGNIYITIIELLNNKISKGAMTYLGPVKESNICEVCK